MEKRLNMFEDAHRPLLSRGLFAARMAVFAITAIILDGLALAAGAIGYHSLEGLDWLDASLDAALVMTGNGPIHHPRTPAGKLFTILHALLGVILFATVIAVLLIPVFHRTLHAFHVRHGHNSENNERQGPVAWEQRPVSKASAG